MSVRFRTERARTTAARPPTPTTPCVPRLNAGIPDGITVPVSTSRMKGGLSATRSRKLVPPARAAPRRGTGSRAANSVAYAALAVRPLLTVRASARARIGAAIRIRTIKPFYTYQSPCVPLNDAEVVAGRVVDSIGRHRPSVAWGPIQGALQGRYGWLWCPIAMSHGSRPFHPVPIRLFQARTVFVEVR